MKKLLFCTLYILLYLTQLSSLEIYLNDQLWSNYSSEDVSDLQIHIDNLGEESKAIPLPLILPLMDDLQALLVRFSGGEILYDASQVKEQVEQSQIILEPQLSVKLQNNSYSDPYEIRVYGKQATQSSYEIWIEKSIQGLDEALDLWATNHKIDINISYKPQVLDHVDSAKISGDSLPNFLIAPQSMDDKLSEQIICYQLQGLLLLESADGPLILPSSHKYHPQLYMSILSSFSRTEPSPEDLIKASEIYNELVTTKRVTEYHYQKQGCFFPRESFIDIPGDLVPLIQLYGMDSPLAPRLYPMVMTNFDEPHIGNQLYQFLSLPGIQYQLYQPSVRQLPFQSIPTTFFDESAIQAYNELYSELNGAYILSQENRTFFEYLEKGMLTVLSDPLEFYSLYHPKGDQNGE